MARARNIKPGFFKNDLLAECSPLARIMFAGLWCIADRAGRLECRPKRIKAEVLPYDDCDIEALLYELIEYGFIVAYSSNDIQYIQILNFEKHQNPHKNEHKSTIPAPEKYSASTVQEPEKHSSNRADSFNLIPDSLNSDSSMTTPNGVVADSKAVSMCPHQKIIDLYHQHLPMCPIVRDWTDTRRRMLQTRWKEKKERQSLDWWEAFFMYVAKSDFLTGKLPGRNGGKPFLVDLEWLIKPTNFVKVIEGRYENGGK